MKTKRHILATLLLLFAGSFPALAQFSPHAKFEVRIDKFTPFFNDLDVHITVSTTGCNLSRISFVHINPTYTLVSANDLDHVFYEREGMFFQLDDDDCQNGQVSIPLKTSIPKSKFAGADELVLLITFKYHRDTWTMRSQPFSLAELEQYLSNTDEDILSQGFDELRRIQASSSGSFIEGTQKKIDIGKRGVSIALSVDSDASLPDVYTHFYLNGEPCSGRIGKVAFTGHKTTTDLFVPYTSLYLPPGLHQLTYRVFGQTDSISSRELFSGTVIITQPQLYWLSFDSKNADISVEGMDKTSHFLRVFSKTAGYGVGDAYYQILNEKDVLFVSPEASDSGYIVDCRGRVQTYRHEPLTISFWDKDGLSSDFIESFNITLTRSGSEQVHIKDKGRIRNFEFQYRLTPVTEENYNKIR